MFERHIIVNNKKSGLFFGIIRDFWGFIPRFRQNQFILILLLSFLTATFEIISIGSALPFISVLIEPEKVYSNTLFNPIFEYYGFDSASEIILPITIIFMIAILISTSMRLILLWANNKWAFNTGTDLSIDIYNKVLSQPYIFHTRKNSSDVINIIYNKVSEIIFYIVMPSIILFTSGIMSLVIIIMLLYFIPMSVGWSILAFVVAYALIIKLIRKRLKVNGQFIADESTQIVKTVQEGLGGIRDILIDNNKATFEASYQNSVKVLRKAQAENQIFGAAPRFFLEAIGLLFVAVFAYSLSIDNADKISIVPILVGLVLAIQRLLPLFQQMFAAWSQMQSALASLSDVVEYLKLEVPADIGDENNRLKNSFNENIKLQNISFQYATKTPTVLKSIDLNIVKGSRVGFVGSTGSGKSTLIDIIMGLLEPTQGSISIDGIMLTKNNKHLWQKQIAHVPQSIYLIDNTIEKNIAFGIDEGKIDQNLVRESAKKAQIADVIEKMPQGYNTVVGERGVQLSGGQRQRLGIARALYKKARVIILDEATSALDSETEKTVIQSFESIGADVTLLMIAHRITTLKNCTNIIELKDGKVLRLIKYEDLRE